MSIIIRFPKQKALSYHMPNLFFNRHKGIKLVSKRFLFSEGGDAEKE